MLKAAAGSLDFIVDTASGIHPLDPYLSLLKYEGIIAAVAAPPEMKFTPELLFMGRWRGQHTHKSMISMSEIITFKMLTYQICWSLWYATLKTLELTKEV